MAAGMYEQIRETNDVYVLKIYRFNISMNGRYAVYCDNSNTFTNPIEVKVSEPPSLPVIVGLQNIENCTDCVVGEDNDLFELACEIHGGTRPLIVTMTIGNESYIPEEWNSTTYMVLFKVRDHHHMENVIFSVMNDALSSPLSVTAKMFVIISPDGRETGENMSTTAYPGDIEKGDNMSAAANPDGRETGDYMSTTGVGLGAVVGSVFAVLAVGILIGVISTLLILTRK
ncbi:uncharacterized protein LOC132747096 isoform X2 [Ruditapes philippinarum]|uniref:uncharacterized protein LOC132747096 isoform X2 n=1 Tax=Ruditapes philippinarum TaxID=129788 RepID=UPI00295C0DFB|nr:uncharacterized protein LOC132747096 isoform X2 [Ruditapes philippinarum]